MNNIKDINTDIGDIIDKIKGLSISDFDVFNSTILSFRLLEVEVSHKIDIESLMSLWDFFERHNISYMVGTVTNINAEDLSAYHCRYARVDGVMLKDGTTLDKDSSSLMESTKQSIHFETVGNEKVFDSNQDLLDYNKINIFFGLQGLFNFFNKSLAWGLTSRVKESVKEGDVFSVNRDDCMRLLSRHVGVQESEQLLTQYEHNSLQKYTNEVHLGVKKKIKGL